MIEYLQAITPSAGVRPLLHWAIHFRHRLRGRRSSQFIKRPAELAPRIPDPSAVAAHAAREASFRRILLQANLLLTVSNFARAKYIQHGYPDDRIRVIPLSTKFAGRVGRRVRAFRGYPVRFGFLGRVTPWKGAHIFAEAARGLSPEHARCTFYGEVEDEDRRYLSALAGGHPGIEFKGRYGHDLLEGILEEIDVLVFPSIMSETQGLVGLEAQAAGLPIIASERGAIPEYVHHETNGLLFSSGNASSLRTQMLRIIEEPDLIARLSSNVAPPKSMGEHVDEVIRAYEDAALVNAALVQS